MLRGGPTDPTGSEGKEHGGHDKLATAAGGVFVLVWIGKDLRFASAGRTKRVVSLVPEGMLIFTRPLTAQPLASSSRPSVRWRSLSQAMNIEGPEMAAMRPRGHNGELKRRKPGQAACDGSESSCDGTKGDVEGGDGADINFFRSADRGLIHIGGVGGGVGELAVSLGIGGALGDLLLDEADVFFVGREKRLPNPNGIVGDARDDGVPITPGAVVEDTVTATKR